MNINLHGSTGTQNDNNFRLNRESPLRARRNRMNGRRDFVAERLSAQARENQIRESENERIAKINEKLQTLCDRVTELNAEIERVAMRTGDAKREEEFRRRTGGPVKPPVPSDEAEAIVFFGTNDMPVPVIEEDDDEFDYLNKGMELLRELTEERDSLDAAIDGLSGQLMRIRMNRTEREMLTMEREFLLMQQELEAKMFEREREAEEKRSENVNLDDKDEEELQAEANRSKMRAFAGMSASMQSVGSLTRTRASLYSASNRLMSDARTHHTIRRIANENSIAAAQSHDVQRVAAFRAAREEANRGLLHGLHGTHVLDFRFKDAPTSAFHSLRQFMSGGFSGGSRVTASLVRAVNDVRIAVELSGVPTGDNAILEMTQRNFNNHVSRVQASLAEQKARIAAESDAVRAEVLRMFGGADDTPPASTDSAPSVQNTPSVQNAPSLDAFREGQRPISERLTGGRRPQGNIPPESISPNLLSNQNTLSQNSFRGRQIARLNAGIAGVDSGIRRQIAELYRNGQELQESQIRINREMSRVERENERREFNENQSEALSY
ncbi:MAG: hypothetical protein FWC70_09175 [Defluviitaleaceae bacterium]|nr:hypothetical protein [Defluviitaleaceae bacterium]